MRFIRYIRRLDQMAKNSGEKASDSPQSKASGGVEGDKETQDIPVFFKTEGIQNKELLFRLQKHSESRQKLTQVLAWSLGLWLSGSSEPSSRYKKGSSSHVP